SCVIMPRPACAPAAPDDSYTSQGGGGNGEAVWSEVVTWTDLPEESMALSQAASGTLFATGLTPTRRPRRREGREIEMRIGILGSGLRGGNVGPLCARAGPRGVFSSARSEQKLKRLAREAGPRAQAGSPADAARDADALLLAVHWSRLGDVLHRAGRIS